MKKCGIPHSKSVPTNLNDFQLRNLKSQRSKNAYLNQIWNETQHVYKHEKSGVKMSADFNDIPDKKILNKASAKRCRNKKKIYLLLLE